MNAERRGRECRPVSIRSDKPAAKPGNGLHSRVLERMPSLGLVHTLVSLPVKTVITD